VAERLLKPLFIGAELRISGLAYEATHVVEFLWPRQPGILQERREAQSLQQLGRTTGITLADFIEIGCQFSGPIGADFEARKKLLER